MIDSLRIATFNIRNGRAIDGINSWPFRRRLALEAISSLDADVIALQEVLGFQLRYLARHLSQYRVVAESRSGGRTGERTPLFIHRDLTVVDDRTRWFGGLRGAGLPSASSPRIATTAVIEAPGATVQVANTHFDQRHESNRRRSALELVSWLGDTGPRVIVGDLNALPGDESISTIARAGYSSAIEGNLGTAHSFTGRADGPQIDYIFVSKGLTIDHTEVVHYRRGNRLPSDHWPIVADIRAVRQDEP